jgi:hypothetical protein
MADLSHIRVGGSLVCCNLLLNAGMVAIQYAYPNQEECGICRVCIPT